MGYVGYSVNHTPSVDQRFETYTPWTYHGKVEHGPLDDHVALRTTSPFP